VLPDADKPKERRAQRRESDAIQEKQRRRVEYAGDMRVRERNLYARAASLHMARERLMLKRAFFMFDAVDG